ncbi:MAG: hypothetical protein LBT40_02885 [Deltaproteobacteria bacterium]|jgi:hypothetical protein|nr:hypothetical protein [Deltaproteobacteria bacterium]
MVNDGDTQAALLARVEKLENDLKDLKFVTLSKMVDDWFGGMNRLLEEFRQSADALKAAAASLPAGGEWVAQMNGLLSDFRGELDDLKASGMVPSEPSGPDEGPKEPKEPKKPRKKKQFKSYAIYLRIKEMQEEGTPYARIAEVLDIPYTTVHSYIRLTSDALEKLKRRHEVESTSDSASPPAAATSTVVLRRHKEHAGSSDPEPEPAPVVSRYDSGPSDDELAASLPPGWEYVRDEDDPKSRPHPENGPVASTSESDLFDSDEDDGSGD